MTGISSRPDWTRRRFLRVAGAGLAAIAAGAKAHAATPSEERADLSAVFQEHSAVGAFALYDVAADRLVTVNGKRAQTRLIPASTFKIANSLIALETGVVKDENEIIPYGGQPQPFKGWEKDMPMREAIVASSVPIYQELARRVGLERYKEWLAKLDYGNAQPGTVVDRFWLDGPLEISAVEQTKFVAKLAQDQLPASQRSQGIVRDILRLETRNGAALHGKTGWRFSKTEHQIGWWTGWVERGGAVNAFSLNIDMNTIEEAKKRIDIGKALLARLGVYS